MIRRYLFIPFALLSIAALGWWGSSIQGGSSTALPGKIGGAAHSKPTESSLEARLELLELLDRMVSYEHYYRSVYGQFTKLLSRTGVWLPRLVADVYEVRVAEASSDRLLITAVSEHGGRTADLVSIDQDFRLRASFPVPDPRSEYLRILAIRHLRMLQAAPSPETVEEQGVFRGYFRYSVDRDSKGGRVVRAEGLRGPATGMKLELGRSLGPIADEELMISEADSVEEPHGGLGFPGLTSVHASESHWIRDAAKLLPASSRGELASMSTFEEVFLAQKIFLGEMGRYARSWEELQMVADFRFEDRERYSLDEISLGELAREFAVSPEIELMPAPASPLPDSHGGRRSPASVPAKPTETGLIVEAL